MIDFVIENSLVNKMDSAFGICGKDWVIVCADTNVNRSIFTLKNDDDKIMQLNEFKVMACTGE